ncbi:hypothetical protein U1Q18_044253, partial [Sarracenia purpurea var. burkii]
RGGSVGVVDESGGGVVDARRHHGWSLVAPSIRKEEAQRYAGDGDAIADGEPSKMAEDGNVGRRSKG